MVDLKIDHNTIFQSGSITEADEGPTTGFTFTNNIMQRNGFGIHGGNKHEGVSTINYYFPNSLISRNVIAGVTAVVGQNCTNSEQAGCYPPDNFYPAYSSFDGLFVNRAGGNYRLANGSPYKNAGTDGLDVGANIDALEAATAGVITGAGQSSPTLLADDFNDNVRDTAKWNLSALNEGPSTFDSQIAILEQNQRLEITPRANVTGSHYGGYVSAATWNLTGAQATVEVLQTASGAADTVFAIQQ